MEVSALTTDIFWRVLVVFSLVFFGIVARKTGAFREEAKDSLAQIMLNITLPPLVFVSMTADITWERILSGAVSPLIALALVGIMLVITKFLSRLVRMKPERRGTFSVVSAMPNTAFIGFPVILAVLGQEGLAYAVLYDIGITLAFCSLAIMALKGGGLEEGSWKSLLNPPLITSVLGLFINRLGLKIPELIFEPLKIMGNATVPLAMLLVGYTLCDLKFDHKVIDLELVMVCIVKLLLYPFFAYLVTLPLNLDPLVRTVIVMQAAMPSMASTPVLTQKYGGDSEFAVTSIFVTTLLSMFSIPFMVYLLV